MEELNDSCCANETLKKILSDRSINQAELVRLCREKGYEVKQDRISKLLSGKKKMSVKECMAFCRALDISVDKLLFGDASGSYEETGFFSLSEKSLKSIAGILGDYKLYYKSTAVEENGKINSGELHLYKEKTNICADIDIHIPRSKKKEYKGYLWVSEQCPVAYIVVKQRGIGEISILALRYREFLSEPMECRTALCLTTSAGEKKEPVVHQVVLVRKGKITEKKQDELLERVSCYVQKLKDYHLGMETDLNLYRLIQEIKEENNG